MSYKLGSKPSMATSYSVTSGKLLMSLNFSFLICKTGIIKPIHGAVGGGGVPSMTRGTSWAPNAHVCF